MAFGRIVVFCSLALCATEAWADQISLKNGDRVTGAIVKKDGATLTVKSAFMGVVTIPWDQVSEIKSDAPLNVVLSSGTVQAALATVDGKLAIEGRQPVAFGDVVALRNADEQRAFERLEHPSWLELWTGTATLGFAGTAGNSRTLTFSTGFNASRTTKTDQTMVYFNAVKASGLVNGVNADTAQAVRGGVAYSHNVTPRLFWNAFNDYEYDRFQALDLRFVLGGGFGFHAIKTDRSKLDLLGGVDYNHSKFSTPLIQNSAEFFWGDDYSLKLNKATSLVQTFRMFDDLTNTGTYRVNFDVGASTKISKWLTWNLSLSDRYLNHPAPGRKTNDFLYTTGVGITFAK